MITYLKLDLKDMKGVQEVAELFYSQEQRLDLLSECCFIYYVIVKVVSNVDRLTDIFEVNNAALYVYDGLTKPVEAHFPFLFV